MLTPCVHQALFRSPRRGLPGRICTSPTTSTFRARRQLLLPPSVLGNLSVDKPGWWGVMLTCNVIYRLESPVTEEQCKVLRRALASATQAARANLELPVTSYSGGCKIKMQLCAAQLLNRDVLILDEPTGHLDLDNFGGKHYLHLVLHSLPFFFFKRHENEG